jgi:predicted dehydrogenase
MKRFSRGYEAFLDSLPESSEGLRLIDVVTHDPWMAREPFVPWSRMTAATDVPAAVIAATADDERRQVADAVGADDEETVRAFSYTFLACLVHDINLVHGALERLGLAGRAEAYASDAWAHGDAAAGSLVLPDGAVWRTSWMLLRGLIEFEERARLYFDDSIHELTFGVPYHSDVPVRHQVRSAARGAARRQETAFVSDAYVAELEHFHACVTEGAPCRTPPEQARDDVAVLRDLFLVRRRTPIESHPTP